jgi:O-antigen ligase
LTTSAPQSIAKDAPTTAKLPFLLLCALTFVIVGRPNDYIPALIPLRLALVGTALTVLATLLSYRATLPSPFRHRETKLYLAFFFAMCFGIPFAVHRGVSFDLVIAIYSSNVIFFLLFVTHVTTRERFRQITYVLLVSGFLFSLIGMLKGQFQSDRLVTAGGMYDPNDVAYVELSLLPFALCVLLGRSGTAGKALALASALLGVLVALYTGSRGGLLGLLTFVSLFLWLRLGSVKAIHKGALLVLLVFAAVLNSDKIDVERYLTLTDLENDYNLSEEWGRKDVWKSGLLIFLRDPLTGVGAENFGRAIGDYRQERGLLPKWQAPHNSFVQIIVEIGIFGAVAFGLLISSSLKTFSRVRRTKDPTGVDETPLWGGALFIGFVAQLVSAFFLTMGYSIFFTLFFAISASLRQIAGETTEEVRALVPRVAPRWAAERATGAAAHRA